MTTIIGVDTGGTFTDTVVVGPDGTPVVGKALSTPPGFADGVLRSLTDAAAEIGRSLKELLAETEVIAHGTTVGLNGLITRSGADAALLVTEGFESTLPLAKANKLRGLPPELVTNALAWDKPHLLIPRRRIAGVRERVDATGRVILPLDRDHALRRIEALLDDGADAIGISLLWATAHPAHEEALAELVASVDPSVPVTLSSELAPRVGEYERTSTVAVNAYVAPLVGSYLEHLRRRLAEEGFGGELFIVTMAGASLPPDTATRAPVHTLHSGPAAGLAGAAELGRHLGHRNIITTDVGGTSFDVGLVVDGEPPLARQPMVERHALAVPAVDITSIGTGGGSIAWVDPILGALKVGPESAGSSPGPASYGRGGKRPTVTDAAVVLGLVDRLGSDLRLDRDAARTAIERDVARPLGLGIEEAAEGILDVAVAHMSDLIRQTTIRRGHDPRDFALHGYGGAAPQYVGRYAAELGVRWVVVPRTAPAFSAAGAATGRLRYLAEREIAPRLIADGGPWLTEVLTELTDRATTELTQGTEIQTTIGADLEIERFVGLRYHRQLNPLLVPIPAPNEPEGAPVIVDDDLLERLARDFRRRHAELVGEDHGMADAPIELVSATVAASIDLPTAPGAQQPDAAPETIRPARRRTAIFDGEAVDTPVFTWDELPAGWQANGPAFIESRQTTLVVHPNTSVTIDPDGHALLHVPG